MQKERSPRHQIGSQIGSQIRSRIGSRIGSAVRIVFLTYGGFHKAQKLHPAGGLSSAEES